MITYEIVRREEFRISLMSVIEKIEMFKTVLGELYYTFDIFDEQFFKNVDLDKSFEVIAKIRERPIGFIAISVTRDMKAYICFIYVKPEFRCLGIGTELVKRALEECRRLGVREVYASLLSNRDSEVVGIDINREAIEKILTKLGFEKIGKYRYVKKMKNETADRHEQKHQKHDTTHRYQIHNTPHR